MNANLCMHANSNSNTNSHALQLRSIQNQKSIVRYVPFSSSNKLTLKRPVQMSTLVAFNWPISWGFDIELPGPINVMPNFKFRMNAASGTPAMETKMDQFICIVIYINIGFGALARTSPLHAPLCADILRFIDWFRFEMPIFFSIHVVSFSLFHLHRS